MRCGWLKVWIVAAAVATMSSAALAQQGSSPQGVGGLINPQRDCQSLVTCQFAKGGGYRGCLSSYSCRTCAFVTAKCKIAGSRGQVCREMRCSWGG